MARRNYMNFSVELTNHCNFKCVYCPHAYYKQQVTPSGNVFDRSKGFMDRELFDKAIDEAQYWAKNVAIGFFGEQQMHPHFDEFVQSVPKKGERKFDFTINSNWSLITEESLPTYNCFNTVRISLDASTKEAWEALCPGSNLLRADGSVGEGRYETLVEKVKWFLQLKHRPKVNLIVVRQEANKEDEKRMVQLWRPLLRKGDRLNTKCILTFGGVVFDPYMPEHRECKVVREHRFVIAHDGRCTPCSLDVNLVMAAGNLRTQTVAEIVASDWWKRTLEGIDKRIGLCSNCFDGQNHSQRTYPG